MHKIFNQAHADGGTLFYFKISDAALSKSAKFVGVTVKYVLKRVSLGSKDCMKELKLECAYFLGQTMKPMIPKDKKTKSTLP